MKAWEVVAYSDDGDLYCVSCMLERYGSKKAIADAEESGDIGVVFYDDLEIGDHCGHCTETLR